jgi:hypothetical protein
MTHNAPTSAQPTGSNREAERVCLNTDPPEVRCGMCGGRCKNDGPRWITCRRCCWSSHNPKRIGLWWRLRVLVGV